jgi:hypothetical protein
MRRLIVFSALTLACALASAPPAAAADKAGARRALERAGLIGSWAEDCARPPSTGNAWEIIAIDGEGVATTTDYEGPDGAGFIIASARRLNSRDLKMRLEVEPGVLEMTVVYRIEGDRQRTWSVANEHGVVMVRDGQWALDEVGQSAWYQRCPGPPAFPASD